MENREPTAFRKPLSTILKQSSTIFSEFQRLLNTYTWDQINLTFTSKISLSTLHKSLEYLLMINLCSEGIDRNTFRKHVANFQSIRCFHTELSFRALECTNYPARAFSLQNIQRHRLSYLFCTQIYIYFYTFFPTKSLRTQLYCFVVMPFM